MCTSKIFVLYTWLNNSCYIVYSVNNKTNIKCKNRVVMTKNDWIDIQIETKILSPSNAYTNTTIL